MTPEALQQIGRAFGKDCMFVPLGKGHINDTYRSSDGKWILQRINTGIFTKPYEVMENIEAVTAWIRRKLRADGGDERRGTLTVIHTADGAPLYTDQSGCWRMYENIAGTHSVEPEERTLTDFCKAAAAFGRFQRELQDFPAEKLHETIPDFHNTPKRFEKLKAAVQACQDRERLEKARPGIEYAFSQERLAQVITSGITDGSIPLSVTHNDTKINNVLFDDDTGETIAVVDLDTVMPGARLYDFGDAVRSGAVTAAEDEPDISKVHFDPEAYLVFREGYLSEMKDTLTDNEMQLLFKSAELLTYECGIRFLTDYLENDVYFKTDYPEHNLVRARNQFRILQEMLDWEKEHR